MRVFALMLAVTFTSVGVFDGNDPFVGTWVYNGQKSPKPTIRYAIRNLGGDRYALTGSTGETTEIKADGQAIKSPSGATVSFKKLDDHNWQMVRNEGEKMLRTFTVSADDRSLTLDDVFTDANGSKDETVTKYARLTPGKGIFGEWQSVAMEEKQSSKRREMVLAAFGADGLSISIPAFKHHVALKFDGKLYFEDGPGNLKPSSDSGKRIDERTLEIDSQNNGQLDEREEWKLSNDGKTLTIVNKPAKSTAVFTSVWDRQ